MDSESDVDESGDKEKEKKEKKGFPTEIKVVFRTHKLTMRNADGEPHPYRLQEMSGWDRDQHTAWSRSKTELVDGVRVTKDFNDLEAMLISRCLFDEETGEKVPLEEIRKLPSHVQHTLSEICYALNALTTEEEDEAKNS